MNEQITLLALKASDPKTGWLDRQKFAELIVRECSNFLKDTLDDHFAAEQLEEHFGVKA